MRAEELLDAWDQGLDPLKDQPVLGAPKTAEDIVDDWDAESGGLLSGIKDMGVYALSAIPSAAQGIVDVGRMATGDPDILKNFSDWIGEQTDSFKDLALSDAALAQQRRLDRVMADPNYSIADLPAVMADNPRATLGSAVESAGSMLLPTGTGVAAARLVGQMGRLAQAGRGGALARVLGNVAPSKAAAAGTMVGNAALNAADTYSSDALENQDQADRYLGALVSAGTSMLGSKVTGGGAENILAQLFTGNAARQIGKNAATRALVGMVKGGGKEFVQEGIEETGNIAGEVVGSGQPIDWNQGAKRVGLASTLGAIMGGPIGATSSIAARPQTIQQEEAATPQDTDVQAVVEGALEAIGDLASTQTPQPVPQASRQEVKPQETPLPQVQPRGQNTEQIQPQAQQIKPTAVDNAEAVSQQNTDQAAAQSTSQTPVILQNRYRSNKASIEQMDRIAGNPDYGRVGIGRDFANGAPVVAYGSVPENQKGRVDYATAATGERIPIQYAVVEADTVSTSHDITGNKNPNYGRTDLVTAIAGNGRVTGIAAAYRKGTAAKYRQELAEDSAMHGVNPEVINGMRNPVLVRIMPNERVTGNIGDLSNTTGNNQLNAVEKAHTDANRVNFEGMEFNEDGSPTQDSIVGFIRSMPAGERAELIDEHGRPNSQAIDRLNNAIFAKAYGNDDVIAMYAMAVDPEAKLVINTLSAVAPKMARLEGCGELDFRGVLIQAVNQIVEGKRKGLKMQDIVKQVDAFTDPDISLFFDLFAQNPRSNKQVIEVLSDAADFAYNEATRDTETEDMFGGVQQATRADLMQHIQQTNNQITELRNAQRQAKRSQASNIQNTAGSVRSGQNAPGGNAGTNPSQNEPRGSSDAQGNEGFSLTGQTESEIEAEAQAREEAEAQRAREESQDQQRQEAQNLRNEVSSLNENYADNFTLTDDSTSAENALRGQGDLRFSRNGVVQASESEISAAKENRKAFRDEIKKKIDSLYPDGTVITVQVESDGAAVFVSKATAKHSLGFRASWRSMLATLKLPELMRTANRVGDFEENPHKNHELVKGAYHYQSKINIDGTEYPVNITVRLHPEGLRMYHAKVDDKKPDAISGAMHNVQSTPPTSGSSDDILSEDGNGSNEPGLKFSRNPETNKPDIKFSVAWHGSPYVFDTFATEHIGTGEGAQAHGWGLYFAADRGVAERYKNVLTDRSASINSVLDELVYSEVDVFSSYIDLDDYETFSREIERGAFSPKTNELLRALEENDWLGYDSPVRAIGQALSPSLSNYEHTPRLDRAVEAFDGEGRVFEVEIPDENSMLDEQKYMGSSKNTELRGKIEFILQEWDYNNPGNPLSLPESPNGREIYQAISDALGGPKEASLYLKRFGIKGITYEGRRDGRCYVVFDDNAIQVLNYYSKIQGDQHGSTVESITQTLSNDSDIGEAFRNLRSRGSVVVVQSESELPGFSMASRSPMKSVDANIRRGKEAMAKALSEKTTVHRAMFRTGMGWVDFVWGDIGGDVKSNGQRPGEKGIAHIIEARQRKDGLTEKQTVAILDRIVETIARGSEVKRREFNGHQRVDLGYNGVLATLVKNPGSNAWLLTGFEIRESDDNRVGKDSPTSTSDAPHTPGAGEVADSLPPRTGNERHALATETVGLGERPSMDVTSSVGSEDLIVKRSTDGSIQGAYDPRTQKVYLVADNLTDENVRAVFMHEVGVHMAADGDMKAVFARAKQIVWNGAANGDKVAQAAKRRMDAAGETSPEEAAAYLVEEAVKAQKDLPKSHPIVQWLEDLMRRVRLWINKKLGVNNLPGLRLTTDDIVAVARANAKSLGNVERKPSNGMTTFADEYKGEWRERRGDLHTNKGGANIWSRNLGLRSGWGKLLERDERGDWKSGWGEHLVTGAGNFVLEAAEYFIPALRTKYAMRMAPKEVREMYRELRAQVDNARRKAGKVAEEMAKWSDNDRRLISDVIEKALDADAHPPEHVLKMASMMSDLMTKQGEDLVALGMLSEESFNRWRGQYLPRFYNRRKELEGEGWFKNFMKRGSPLRGVGGGSLKGRGKYELIEVKDLDKYIAAGWEVRDERYTFNKEAKESQPELTFKDMPEVEVDEHQTVNVWRDWTPKERQEMGEIRDAGYRFVMGYMQMQEDLALGRLFKQIAENPAWTRNTPSEGYSAVLDTVIPETGGVKRYGSLAGKYVKDEVLAQVMPHAEVPSAFARAYRNLLAYWKEGKTALNPVSHMNNTAGNIIMAHLAGVDMWNAKAYWDIAQAFRHNADWLKEAEDNGLFSGSFSKEEIAKLLPEEFTRLEEQQESMAKRGFEFVFNYLLNYGLRQKMRNLYEAEDSFFKALIYKYAKDRGMSTKDAIDYALGFIPTYDDLPGGARFIRDTAVPFFAWTYKIVPRLVTSAAAYPHRFLAPAALMWTANMLTYAIAAGDDDDDWWTRFEKGRKLQDTEEGLLPDYMQGRGFFMNPKFIRLWNDPTTNLPVYWNISNFIPGGQLFDSENQAGGMPWPEMLAIGSPLYTIWAALNLNTDTFTGRDVTKQSDTAGEATEKRATYLWRQLAPALAYGGYHFERVLNGLANATGEPIMGYTGIGRNKEPITPLNAAINTLGLKVRNVDFQKEYQFKMSDIQKVNDEILANIRSLNRQKKIGSIIPLEADKEIEYQREKLKDNTAHSEEITRLNRDRKKLSRGE